MKAISTLLKYFKDSELFRNISTLVAGTALAQLIPIALQPVLRRLYSPETYGVYSVYLSVLGIILVVSSLKYELAVILPRKDKEAANVFAATILISLIINLLIIIAIIIGKKSLIGFLNIPESHAVFLYFVPLGTFLFSYYQSANYWLIRKKKFFSLSLNKFVRRGCEGSAQISLKFIQNSLGLLWGDLIGHIANILSVTYQMFRSDFRISMISRIKLGYVLRKYAEYPKFNVIPSLMSACSYLLPAIFIFKFFNPELAGFFDLTKLVLSIPFALIATSISNVLLQRISERFKEGKSMLKDLLPVALIVISIALVEVIVIQFWGVDLFRLIFGETWETSGRISKILVWSFVLNFITSSFSSVFIAMRRIKMLSLWQLTYFIAISCLLFFKDKAFTDFLKIYVMIEIACYTLITILVVYIIYRFELNARNA